MLLRLPDSVLPALPSHPAALRLAALAAPLAALPALGGAVIGQGAALPVLLPVLLFLAVAGVAVLALPEAHGHARLGPANGVTLARAALASLVLAAVVAGEAPMVQHRLAWALTGAVAVALALDGLDGWLARRTGLASRFGARFDMEVDALLAALLAVLALVSGKAGVWVLALGFMRYGFVAAMAVWPWLGGDLPPRRGRKTVCVIQIATLAALLAPPVAPPVSTLLGGVATALLVGSFGRDIVWLRARAR